MGPTHKDNFSNIDDETMENYSLQSGLYKSVGRKRIGQNTGDMAPTPHVKTISKCKQGKKAFKTTKIVKCLVDHGSGSSLVTKDCVLHNRTHSGASTQWKTTAGTFTTKKKPQSTSK